jgi:transcriptional regulator with XRE-family HTH domain
MRDDDLYRDIGARLRRRRRGLGLTQRQVSVSCGLTFQQIQKYEAGYVAIPVARLVQLSRVLQAPLASFLADDGAAPMTPPAQVESVAA